MTNIRVSVTEDPVVTLKTAGSTRAKLRVAEQIINRGGSLSDEVKQAILDCFEHVAWVDEYGQDYYDALYAALYPPTELDYITAVYTQSGTVYDTDTLDSLKADLVVTAYYDDGTSEPVTAYTLSGTLEEGTSTITVSYGGKTTTFNVTVTNSFPAGYTPYDYITFDGSQYANSGVYESADMLSAEYKFSKKYNYTNVNMHILSSANVYYPYASNDNGNRSWKTKFNGNESDGFQSVWSADTDYTVKCDFDAKEIYLDGELKASGITLGNTYSVSNQLTIGTYGGSVGTTKYRLIGRLYYLKLYNGNVIVHDFKPAKRTSDDAVGFYDLATDNFITAASGTFTGGNVE